MSNRIILEGVGIVSVIGSLVFVGLEISQNTAAVRGATQQDISYQISEMYKICLLYTSPSPRDISGSRMPSSA